MNYKAFGALTVSLACSLCAPAAFGSFASGSFAADDDWAFVGFGLNQTSTVTLLTNSYASGGFDPILTLFEQSTGDLIDSNNDGTANDPESCVVSADPSTGKAHDACLVVMLLAGTYTIAITQFDNFANGLNLSSGFFHAGSTHFTSVFGCSNGQFCDSGGNNRTGNWELNITQVPASAPEPSIVALLGLGLAGIGFRRRNKTV